MSEILKSEGGGNDSNEWEDMAEGVGIEKRLEDGENPEDVVKAVYEEGRLTPDFMEEYGSTLMQYGLSEDKYEHYEELSRQHDQESLEDTRRHFDEEPEQEGYEPKAV